MNLAEAKLITGGLSTPNKMPCHSYNLPAWDCKLGSILARVHGSVCRNCYARKGRYIFRNVREAMDRRLLAISHPQWVEAMAFLINHYEKRTGFFRWHDSGDLQSAQHYKDICEVARQTPNVRHWLPTRETGFIKQARTKSPPNLCIRVSANMVDGAYPKQVQFVSKVVSSFNGVPSKERCVAQETGTNICGSCRKCWLEKKVAYKEH